MSLLNSFDDLAHLSDDDMMKLITKLLKTADLQNLIVALSKSHYDVKQKFLENMPTNVLRRWVEDRIEVQFFDPHGEVEKAQQRIMILAEEIGLIIAEEAKTENQPKSENSEDPLKVLLQRPLAQLSFEDLNEIFTSLSATVRRESHLALQEQVGFMEEKYLKEGIQMVLDREKPDRIKKILDFWMESLLDEQKKKYLKIREGILAIQAGDNPRIVQQKMSVLF